MSTPSKLHRLCVFMTPADETRFSDAVRTSLPAVRFVDASQQPETHTPRYHSSLSECAGPHVTLVDTSIISESMFHRDYVVPHPSGRGWVYAIVGAGLASLVRSRSEADSLRNGELRASVPAGDTRTADYIRELLKLVRTGGTGVFAVDALTSDTPPRAERNFVAWPDAASRFGAKETPLLTNGPTAWFTIDR